MVDTKDFIRRLSFKIEVALIQELYASGIDAEAFTRDQREAVCRKIVAASESIVKEVQKFT